MGHHLNIRTVNAIRQLKQQGLSNRRIAKELDVDRKAVARHLQIAQRGANNNLEATADRGHGKNTRNSGTQRASGRPSKCAAFRNAVLSKLRDGCNAQQIHDELSKEKGFEGSYYSVRRLVRRLKDVFPTPEIPTHLTRRWRNANDANWMLAVLEGTKSVEVLRGELGVLTDISSGSPRPAVRRRFRDTPPRRPWQLRSAGARRAPGRLRDTMCGEAFPDDFDPQSYSHRRTIELVPPV
jgi:transposase